MIGKLGKCPAKKGSLMVTFLMATIRCLGWISITRSISKKGKRCGRMWKISTMSSVVFTGAGDAVGGWAVSVIFSRQALLVRSKDYTVPRLSRGILRE